MSETATIQAATAPAADLLTMEQVAERLQIRRETLFRWSCSGRFPVAILRLGAARRIRAAELADWILAGCPSRAAWRWPENPSKGT